MSGLYTGIKAKIVQSVFNSAIMLMIYERTVLILKQIVENGGQNKWLYVFVEDDIIWYRVLIG